MKSQPVLPLRTMSESIQHQESVSMSTAHINTIEHGDVLVWTVTWMSMVCAELVLPLTGGGALKSCPIAHWRFVFLFLFRGGLQG